MGSLSQDDADDETNGRQHEFARASRDCAALLDHHVEELLNAFNELAERRRDQAE